MWIVWPVSLISLFWRFYALLRVATVSTSIVLSSSQAKDAIFDCLAIEFVSFLDETTWNFVKLTFDVKIIDDFRVKVKYGKEVMRSKRCSCLRSGTGGRRFESVVAGLLLSFIYVMHFVEVLQALDSHIVPAERYLCSRWRWMVGNMDGSLTFIQRFLYRVQVGMISFVHDPYRDFERFADQANDGVCSERYHDLSIYEMWEIMKAHYYISCVFAVALLTLLFFTRLLHYLGFGNKVAKLLFENSAAYSDHSQAFVDLQNGIASRIFNEDHAAILSQLVHLVHTQHVQLTEQAKKLEAFTTVGSPLPSSCD
eukprot:TRINITY_DN15278_c0_g1_i2.p1 TRINITY_DN15278_c0_g1~~TRINITY_DN15278_c0_g1_i2.p1  ORF type:complete len:311 (-),score=46.52 TRINITY_DN15278_c0_g1_i2:140-1072(-)